MLSVFPQLFDYSILAIFAIRGTLGVMFVLFAYIKFFRDRPARIAFFEKLNMRPAVFFFALITGIELVVGIALTIGLFTQVMALIAGALMIFAAGIKWRRPEMLPKNTILFYIFLAIVSFSLLFLGPGAFAFDMPL